MSHLVYLDTIIFQSSLVIKELRKDLGVATSSEKNLFQLTNK